jgi:hypothetical protein
MTDQQQRHGLADCAVRDMHMVPDTRQRMRAPAWKRLDRR